LEQGQNKEKRFMSRNFKKKGVRGRRNKGNLRRKGKMNKNLASHGLVFTYDRENKRPQNSCKRRTERLCLLENGCRKGRFFSRFFSMDAILNHDFEGKAAKGNRTQFPGQENVDGKGSCRGGKNFFQREEGVHLFVQK